MRSIR